MTKFFKKFFFSMLAVVLVIAGISLAVPGETGLISQLTVSAYADEVSWPTGPEVTADSAIVIEAATGTVLYEKNADAQHYPASITKIMTTLLALENSSLDEVVTFSADAVYKNEGDSSHIARDLDEQMTMEQCLYAVMLESANECAYAVAEHVGDGDYQAFVDLMNEKAAELGCTNTTFTNANGLPDESHVTSCRDMALIAQAAIANSTFRQIVGTVKYTIPPTNKHDEETILNNHHRMISSYKGTSYLYEYCIGGKTGYTVAAGNTLVTYAEKDGMLLICVVMQAPSQYEDTTSLFEYCFANYTMYNVAENETRYGDAGVGTASLFSEIQPYAELDPDAQIILPATAEFADTEVEISYEEAGGSTVGTLVYSYGGKQVGTADVVTTGASAATYVFGSGTSDSAEESDNHDTDDSNRADEDDETDNGSSVGADDADDGTDTGIAADTDTVSETDQVLSGSSAFSLQNTNKDRVILIISIIAAAAVVIFVIIPNIRRARRRKRARERRYKEITGDRRRNRRRRR